MKTCLICCGRLPTKTFHQSFVTCVFMADNKDGCAEQLLSESDEKSDDSSRNRSSHVHKAQKQLPSADTFIHNVPNTDSIDYNPNKFTYKCFRFIYNFFIFIFSISNTIVNILIIVYLGGLSDSDTIYNTFFILLLSWTCIVRCFYYRLFIYHYPLNNGGRCGIFVFLVFAPFTPVIFFLFIKMTVFFHNCFA